MLNWQNPNEVKKGGAREQDILFKKKVKEQLRNNKVNNFYYLIIRIKKYHMIRHILKLYELIKVKNKAEVSLKLNWLLSVLY